MPPPTTDGSTDAPEPRARPSAPETPWQKVSEQDPEIEVARVIRDRQTLCLVRIEWDRIGEHWVIRGGEFGLDLEYSELKSVAMRLADMYLDGFREGYDLGYADRTDETRKRSRVKQRGNDAAPGNRRDRDDDEGRTEGDRPG